MVARHSYVGPTVITTRALNLKEDLAFSPQINEAITSRLTDVHNVLEIELKSKDFRS